MLFKYLTKNVLLLSTCYGVHSRKEVSVMRTVLTSGEGRLNAVKTNSKEQREISVNISFSWQKGYKILLGISTEDVGLNACLNV